MALFRNRAAAAAAPPLASSLQAGAALPGDDRRRHPRFEVRAPAHCLIGAERIDVIIIDVSAGGLGLDRPLPCETNSQFQIVIPDVGTFRARLAWKGPERCGLELLPADRELSAGGVDQLAGWLQRVEALRNG